MAHAPPQRDVFLLLALALAAYANAFQGAFQFDDYNVIVLNPRVQSLAAWWQSMPGIRPLLKFSYALNLSSGLGLFGFHLFNLALHGANGILVYRVLRAFARRAGMEQHGEQAAWFAAALFVVHPINSEAVTYLSGRSMSLMTLFYLGSLLAYVRRAENGRGAAWLSPALFAGALLVKESALTLPLALLLWETTDRPRPNAVHPELVEGRTEFLAARQGWHWALLAAGLLAIAASPTYRWMLAASWTVHPLSESLSAQPHAILYLAGQALRIVSLNADPALPWTPSSGVESAVVAAALLFGLAQLRRRPWLGFGLTWFFLQLLPTHTLWPRLDAVNERHFYLAGIGLFWLAGHAASRLAEYGKPWWWRLAAALLIVALTVATAQRNSVYRDEISFWKDVAAKAPHNPRAFNNLGYAYSQAGRAAEAERAYRRALALAPENLRASANLRALGKTVEE